jgi:hypothetical protein
LGRTGGEGGALTVLGRALLVPALDDDLAAESRQPLSESPPEPPAGAGDQCDLARQLGAEVGLIGGDRVGVPLCRPRERIFGFLPGGTGAPRLTFSSVGDGDGGWALKRYGWWLGL